MTFRISSRTNSECSSDCFRTEYLSFVVPILFLLFGLYWITYVDDRLTVNGYVVINGSWGILNGYGYTGLAADSWPPLYPLLVHFFGYGPGLEFGGRVVSLLSGTCLLAVLPYLTNSLGKSYVPGLVGQIILASSPDFFNYAILVENYMLDAALFVLAVYFGVNYFKKSPEHFPLCFIVFGSLACLTRYPSWILPISFLLVLVRFDGLLKKSQTVLRTTGGFVLMIVPWLLYNYFYNGVFLSRSKGKIIAFSLAENGLLNVGLPHVYYRTIHEYESAIGIIRDFPMLYLRNLVIHASKWFEIIFVEFPPLGAFTICFAVGLTSIILRSNEREYFFVLATITLFSVLIFLTRYSWKYFLHIGSITGTLGLLFLYQKISSLPDRFYFGTRMKYLGVFLVVFLGSFFQFHYHSARSQNLFASESIDTLKKDLKNFADSGKPGLWKTSIMASFYYVAPIYQTGFRPILALIPESSPEELLCYRGGITGQREFFNTMNFPPGQTNPDFIPPDYLLIDRYLLTAIRNEPNITVKEILKHLREVTVWGVNHELVLYRVQKDTLGC